MLENCQENANRAAAAAVMLVIYVAHRLCRSIANTTCVCATKPFYVAICITFSHVDHITLPRVFLQYYFK